MDNSRSQRSSFEPIEVKVKGHSILHIGIIIFTFLSLCATIFINAASSTTAFKIFKQQTNVISDNNPTNITPAGWTFSTWGIIYTFQCLIYIYNVILIFRKTEAGPLYRSPKVLTPLFHICYLSSLGFNIAWLFLWDEVKLDIAFYIITLLAISLYICTIISHKNIYNGTQQLRRNNRADLWLYRIFVNNGLAFYVTWVTIASNLNLAIALAHHWKALDQEQASLVALGVLSFIIIVYFILDISVCEKYTRYTLSPYVQMAIAFAGVLTKHWNFNDPKPSFIYALTLAILGPIIMFLIKIIVMIYKHNKA